MILSDLVRQIGPPHATHERRCSMPTMSHPSEVGESECSPRCVHSQVCSFYHVTPSRRRRNLKSSTDNTRTRQRHTQRTVGAKSAGRRSGWDQTSFKGQRQSAQQKTVTPQMPKAPLLRNAEDNLERIVIYLQDWRDVGMRDRIHGIDRMTWKAHSKRTF